MTRQGIGRWSAYLVAGLAVLVLLGGCSRPKQDDDTVRLSVEATLTAIAEEHIQATALAESIAPSSTPTVRPTETQWPTNTPWPTRTPLPPPTLTPTPSSTTTQTPTITPIDTPTPGPYALAVTAVNLRAGPGTNYAVVDTAKQGQPYAIQGRLIDSSWLEVCCVGQQTAWVAASVVTVSGDLSDISVSQNIPPSPTTAPAPVSRIPAGWVEYVDPANRFVLWHPADWSANPSAGAQNADFTSLWINAEENNPPNHAMSFKLDNTPVDLVSVNRRTSLVLGVEVFVDVVLLPYDAHRSISAVIMRSKKDIDPAVLQLFIQVLQTIQAK